jgi:CheY-like chemotaxis protein
MAHILVVDDDRDHRLALVAMLRGAGHEAIEAADGKNALDLCRETEIDVVVTDLQMPEIHGLELITLLRDLSPPPPIVAVSGTGSDQLSVAEALGAWVTLSKPVLPDKLLGAVDEALLAGEDEAPVLVVSDPPHLNVDLDAASAIIGLDIFQTRLKFAFPGPEVLAASDGRRAAEIGRTFNDAGVKLAVMDGQELAAVPWPDPVSVFAFTDTGLTVTLQHRATKLPYDSSGVGVYCSPPPDFRPNRPPTKELSLDSDWSPLLRNDGPEVVEAIEWMSNLDLYFVRDDVLRRVSIVEGLTDFSGLGPLRQPTAAANMKATLTECMRRFPRIKFDTRLENVRPRGRFARGDSEQTSGVRKRYSFGTSLLGDVLESISPDIRDLTQFELGSRLAYLTTRNRPPDWRSPRS